MLHLKSILAACVLAFASLAMAGPALAQGTKIVVVDDQKIFQDSKAGQDIRTKLQTIAGQMDRELEANRTAVDQLRAGLESRTANMSDEAIVADAGLQAQFAEFQSKASTLARDTQIRAQELAATERNAQIAFRQALRPVLEEVLREQNAQIVMSNSDVVLALPTVDVTTLVVQKMDTRTPTIAVTRVRAPAQPGQ